MITKEQYAKARAYTLAALEQADIKLTEQEKNDIEVADFGLERLREVGLQVVTYVNTDRCCAKELVLMPGQICPEHRHPMINGMPGKEETFRCRRGKVLLYVEGHPDFDKKTNIQAAIPEDIRKYFTVFREICLLPGEQYTLKEDMHHWFMAGDEGCIVSEFSTKSIDELDVFTDPGINRIPDVEA